MLATNSSLEEVQGSYPGGQRCELCSKVPGLKDSQLPRLTRYCWSQKRQNVVSVAGSGTHVCPIPVLSSLTPPSQPSKTSNPTPIHPSTRPPVHKLLAAAVRLGGRMASVKTPKPRCAKLRAHQARRGISCDSYLQPPKVTLLSLSCGLNQMLPSRALGPESPGA